MDFTKSFTKEERELFLSKIIASRTKITTKSKIEESNPKWFDTNFDDYECSHCEYIVPKKWCHEGFNFCPNCGCHMDN